MKRAFLVLSVILLAATGVFGQGKASSYEPRKGDIGIRNVFDIVPGKFEELKKLFTDLVLPSALNDAIIRDGYFVVSEDGSQVISLMLNAPEAGDRELYPSVFDTLATRFVKNQKSETFKVMVAFNENFYPVIGDKAVVITRHIKEGMFEEAKAYLENSMITSLSADAYSRYYIVVEQGRTNTLVAFSLLRGEVVSNPKVIAIRESGFNRFMAEPFEMKTFTFFAVSEE